MMVSEVKALGLLIFSVVAAFVMVSVFAAVAFLDYCLSLIDKLLSDTDD